MYVYRQTKMKFLQSTPHINHNGKVWQQHIIWSFLSILFSKYVYILVC